MSITRFFENTLRARMRNPRFWGAFDPVCNRVFLKVWKDQIERDAAGERVLIYRKNAARNSAGYAERRRHIEAIRNGAEAFGVVCTAREAHANPYTLRKIRGFDRDTLVRFRVRSSFRRQPRYLRAHGSACSH